MAERLGTSRAYLDFLQAHASLQSGGIEKQSLFVRAEIGFAACALKERKIRKFIVEDIAMTREHHQAIHDCLKTLDLWTEDPKGLTLRICITNTGIPRHLVRIPTGNYVGEMGVTPDAPGSSSAEVVREEWVGGASCSLSLEGTERGAVPACSDALQRNLEALFRKWRMMRDD